MVHRGVDYRVLNSRGVAISWDSGEKSNNLEKTQNGGCELQQDFRSNKNKDPPQAAGQIVDPFFAQGFIIGNVLALEEIPNLPQKHAKDQQNDDLGDDKNVV